MFFLLLENLNDWWTTLVYVLLASCSRYWLACGISPWLNECPEQNMLETNAVTLDVGLPPWMTDSRLWFMFLLEIGTLLLKTKWKRETHVELSYVDRNDWMQADITNSFSCYCSSTLMMECRELLMCLLPEMYLPLFAYLTNRETRGSNIDARYNIPRLNLTWRCVLTSMNDWKTRT